MAVWSPSSHRCANECVSWRWYWRWHAWEHDAGGTGSPVVFVGPDFDAGGARCGCRCAPVFCGHASAGLAAHAHTVRRRHIAATAAYPVAWCPQCRCRSQRQRHCACASVTVHACGGATTASAAVPACVDRSDSYGPGVDCVASVDCVAGVNCVAAEPASADQDGGRTSHHSVGVAASRGF